MTPAKKAGIITCFISAVVSVATSIGLGIYYLYPPSHNLQQQLQFTATFNNSETIYMSINSTYIQYDLLIPDQNKTGYLLTRFFSSPLPTFAQTFISY